MKKQPKPKVEFTSKQVASIAGKLLRKLNGMPGKFEIAMARRFTDRDYFALAFYAICTVDELRAVCASALTQARQAK